ncbi:MAG: hypothetical protein A2Y64_06365 [Candidatus Coatesbacteria bacterium RBG_13_66_14]|uniref:Secretion system C-terminal sorting domain-containing protein n=1 Tax=Candidatus Coatesbacteria bacterium RBG_13_66_14 TaxID=1817816 RepID=A0A1F5FJD9_9BACT|nr:MAG: hypothetical protein A2Y64_06365 [Candidatus Coatesbacteria bacterium RBG_13_66_14]
MRRIATLIPLMPILAQAGINLTTTPVWESGDLIEGEYPYSTGCDWADVDGDSRVDLVVSNGNDMRREYCAVYLNSPEGLDPEPAWFGEPLEYHGHLECCDLDSDGDPDLAVTLLGGGYPDWTYGHDALYVNLGSAFETAPSWEGGPAHNAFGIAWGDYDSDGDADLAVAGGIDYVLRAEPLRIYENEDGVLNPVPAWESEKSSYWMDVLFGDFDNDGFLDLAAASEHGSNAVFFGTGDGLAETPGWEDSPEWDTLKIAAGDLNGDGWLDLVLANNNQIGEGQVNLIHLSNHNLFDAEPDWVSSDIEMSSYAALADLDADGDLDLAIGGWWNPIRIYENRNGRFNPEADWLSDFGYDPVTEALLFEDYDDDGLTSGRERFTGDGAAGCFRLSVMPVRSVDEVRVDGVPLPRDAWCCGRQEGWVSLGVTPPAGAEVEISYTCSTDLDLAQTDWSKTEPNVLLRNDGVLELYAFQALRRDDGVLLSWKMGNGAVGVYLYRQGFSPTTITGDYLGMHDAAYRSALARGRVPGEEPGPWEPLHPERIGGLEGMYLDREPPSGRVRFDPVEVYVGKGEGALPQKSESSLDLPWPSPADDRIVFEVVISGPDAGRPVTLTVYDLAGRSVILLFTGELTEGSHRVTADTARLAPGVYVLRLETATAAVNRRFAVAR